MTGRMIIDVVCGDNEAPYLSMKYSTTGRILVKNTRTEKFTAMLFLCSLRLRGIIGYVAG